MKTKTPKKLHIMEFFIVLWLLFVYMNHSAVRNAARLEMSKGIPFLNSTSIPYYFTFYVLPLILFGWAWYRRKKGKERRP